MQNRKLDSIYNYCLQLCQANGAQLESGTVLAKILTSNDDASKHGVLIPTEAYDHFPVFEIENRYQNQTLGFYACDTIAHISKPIAYKYYERYPERRITKLHSDFNDRSNGRRLAIFLKAIDKHGNVTYYYDLAREKIDSDFWALKSLIFGDDIAPNEGCFILTDIGYNTYKKDEILDELISKFDTVNNMGWVKSLRDGDTGIGYTFETLIGIEENNDKKADFKGIEIKCKQIKNAAANGKINLFQQAPIWTIKESAANRIRRIGQQGLDSLYSCYSQVTTNKNNLGLFLETGISSHQIDLFKDAGHIGYWPNIDIESRLLEKHARSVFVKAEVKGNKSGQKFFYKEMIYCEKPNIHRFLDLLKKRQIVFEFTMSEKADGKIRNHGYPWRLINEELLTELFSLQVRVR